MAPRAVRLPAQRTNRFAGVRVSLAHSKAAACRVVPPPYRVACGARRIGRTVLTRTRSSASSRRVAIRPAPVAESSSSCGIMAQQWASQPPREVPEDFLDRGLVSRYL